MTFCTQVLSVYFKITLLQPQLGAQLAPTPTAILFWLSVWAQVSSRCFSFPELNTFKLPFRHDHVCYCVFKFVTELSRECPTFSDMSRWTPSGFLSEINCALLMTPILCLVYYVCIPCHLQVPGIHQVKFTYQSPHDIFIICCLYSSDANYDSEFEYDWFQVYCTWMSLW